MSNALLNNYSNSQTPAGTNIKLRDLVEINGYGGLAYPCRVTDYAGLKAISSGGNNNISLSPTNALNRNPIAQSVKGFVFSAGYSTNSPPASLQVQKWTPLISPASPAATLVVDPTSTTMNSVMLLALSNNTMAIVWSEGASSPFNIYYAIFDTNLNIVVAKTSVDVAPTANLFAVSNYNAALGLAGTGFSIVYQSASSNTQIHFAAYDNAGNVVANGPATVVQTFGNVGTAALATIKLLPNGNLAYAAVSGSGTAGSLGVWVGVVSAAGAIVAAPANALATTDATITARPEIAVAVAGATFAVSCGVTTWKVAVFNLSGAIVGAQHATGTASTSSNLSRKMVFSSGQYNLLWTTGSGAPISLTQIPVTGTNYVDGVIISGTTSELIMDAIGPNNMLVGVLASSNTTCSYFVIELPTINGGIAPNVLLVPTVYLTTGSGSPTASQFLSVLDGGDFTFLSVADFDTGARYFVVYQKFAPSAIVGVAGAAVSAGGDVPLSDTIDTTQEINQLAGSPSVNFNMTSPTPPSVGGREGSMTNLNVQFSG